MRPYEEDRADHGAVALLAQRNGARFTPRDERAFVGMLPNSDQLYAIETRNGIVALSEGSPSRHALCDSVLVVRR